MLNAVFMAMPYKGCSHEYTNILDVADVVFTVVFVIELVLKVSGLGGFKTYWSNPLNVFDFSLLILTFGSAVVTVTGIITSHAWVSASLLSVQG